MKVLLVVRKGSPNVAAGWIAKVGSVNEHSGVTGISHLFEHMMFKGTQTIGTKSIEEDLKLNLELDRVKAELRKRVRFQRINLFQAEYPVAREQHVIFCRNVMIYFDPSSRATLVHSSRSSPPNCLNQPPSLKPSSPSGSWTTPSSVTF